MEKGEEHRPTPAPLSLLKAAAASAPAAALNLAPFDSKRLSANHPQFESLNLSIVIPFPFSLHRIALPSAFHRYTPPPGSDFIFFLICCSLEPPLRDPFLLFLPSLF
ncbi:hypothetical protein VTJ04DRAFT_262 [Mycothermus thermophilus]|uniref:uncharacterized protein n=1 Tax=Humicola insolens TaxID=85995 RepID=UPI003743758E